jgi:hypothetical protein
MSDLSDDEILEVLGLDDEPKKQGGRSHEEARVIAGFEDIVRFVDEYGRPPALGEGKDIFERLYAVRLDRIRANPAHRALVANLDRHGLLSGGSEQAQGEIATLSDDELLEELRELDEDGADISTLTHVKPRAEIKAAEEIANRTPCKDFARFKPLFAKVQADLDAGVREARRFKDDASIEQGQFFILGGQMVYVAEMGEEFVTTYDRPDRRLRVVYDNGMESDILLRSLQRALNKDETGRRITDPDAGPLFASVANEGDTETGTIYVLQSLSSLPAIVEHREIIHKIGVTGGDVVGRIAGAEMSATYLFAGVKVVATYKLYNVNRSRLENLLHRFFAVARLDVEIPDRFGRTVRPREWFLVPLSVIDEVVERIRDRTLTAYRYDPKKVLLVRVEPGIERKR